MYIFDLEGTISNHNHRIHLLPTAAEKMANYGKGRPDDMYQKFHDHFHKDEVNSDVKLLMDCCIYTTKTIILTGMMERFRQDAQEWLLRNGISHNGLFMRPNDCYLSSPEYKYQWIRHCGEKIHLVYDDRKDVVDKLLSHGIPAILVK